MNVNALTLMNINVKVGTLTMLINERVSRRHAFINIFHPLTKEQPMTTTDPPDANEPPTADVLRFKSKRDAAMDDLFPFTDADDLKRLSDKVKARIGLLLSAAPALLEWSEEDAVAAFRRWYRASR